MTWINTFLIPWIFPHGISGYFSLISSGKALTASPIVVNSKATAQIVLGSSRNTS